MHTLGLFGDKSQVQLQVTSKLTWDQHLTTGQETTFVACPGLGCLWIDETLKM